MNKYRLVSKKGEGTFSEVLKAQSIVTGSYVAIKCMKSHFKSIEQVNSLREIQALRRLNPHHNIIDLEEVLYDKQTGRLALVFELMDLNLYEMIRGRVHPVRSSLICHYMYQLLRAVAHMHKHGIFHRDIKPENILINVEQEQLKVADFGSCRGIYTSAPYTEYISTRWYRAPECLLTNGYYDYKMDIWGIGCVMFEVIALFPLFPGTNELDQIEKIHAILGTPSQAIMDQLKKHSSHVANLNFPPRQGTGIARLVPHASPECIDLMELLLAYDPEKRITARQALRHPYFRQVREQERRNKLRTANATTSPNMYLINNQRGDADEDDLDEKENEKENEMEKEKEKEKQVKNKLESSGKFPSLSVSNSVSANASPASVTTSLKLITTTTSGVKDTYLIPTHATTATSTSTSKDNLYLSPKHKRTRSKTQIKQKGLTTQTSLAEIMPATDVDDTTTEDKLEDMSIGEDKSDEPTYADPTQPRETAHEAVLLPVMNDRAGDGDDTTADEDDDISETSTMDEQVKKSRQPHTRTRSIPSATSTVTTLPTTTSTSTSTPLSSSIDLSDPLRSSNDKLYVIKNDTSHPPHKTHDLDPIPAPTTISSSSASSSSALPSGQTPSLSKSLVGLSASHTKKQTQSQNQNHTRSTANLSLNLNKSLTSPIKSFPGSTTTTATATATSNPSTLPSASTVSSSLPHAHPHPISRPSKHYYTHQSTKIKMRSSLNMHAGALLPSISSTTLPSHTLLSSTSLKSTAGNTNLNAQSHDNVSSNYLHPQSHPHGRSRSRSPSPSPSDPPLSQTNIRSPSKKSQSVIVSSPIRTSQLASSSSTSTLLPATGTRASINIKSGATRSNGRVSSISSISGLPVAMPHVKEMRKSYNSAVLNMSLQVGGNGGRYKGR